MDTSIESEDSMARIRPSIATSISSQVTRSRPISLLSLAPEKEPLIFDVNLVGAPPEVEQLVEHIKTVAEQFLYHWKTFPIRKSPFPFRTINYTIIIFSLTPCSIEIINRS